MKARAIQKNVHISSRKAGLVCALIRNKKVAEALIILDNTDKKVAGIFKKLLNSAVANATNNHQMHGEKLYIYLATANQGTTIKRSLPRAKGSAHMIRKRHSHLEIVLSDDPKQRLLDEQMRTQGIKKSKAHVDKKITSAQKTPVKVETEKPKVKLHTEEENK